MKHYGRDDLGRDYSGRDDSGRDFYEKGFGFRKIF
jgi:hypothetical protein